MKKSRIADRLFDLDVISFLLTCIAATWTVNREYTGYRTYMLSHMPVGLYYIVTFLIVTAALLSVTGIVVMLFFWGSKKFIAYKVRQLDKQEGKINK